MFKAYLTTFTELHTQAVPLLLVNVWDAASAVLVQQSGAKALATSSAAVAWSLGYPDGEALPREMLLHAVKNIIRISVLPVTVDIETGYSRNASEVVSLVAELVKLGVVGINIEDGDESPEILIAKIKAIRSSTSCSSIFINARTDVFLHEIAENDVALSMAKMRLVSYQAAGANCGFIPGISSDKMAAYLAEELGMPLNFMVEDLTASSIDGLFKLGVSRFSVGPASFLAAYSGLTDKDYRLNYSTVNQLLM
ncbi:isocitrate lyase/phosphoenolpyruvate mutase family protein [Shewanella sp. VB17]|uniref:isocitrate lyase/PEP mutase family protein n=1 Tax=Shewanella sp. VB17 TaxID=2739432 RepID=UPI001564B536|nr:isocitrate lyase/phosphoenolpyruvate mutase family protein [Shewanella sp. VB17]NRD75549.1 isocitrate lyase/phosphoenolpyruvate mutase family protein [Shewanella sp. VB17]